MNYFHICSPKPSSLQLNLSFCPHSHLVYTFPHLHNLGFPSYSWWSYCNILFTNNSRWFCLREAKSKIYYVIFSSMALTVSVALIFNQIKNSYDQVWNLISPFFNHKFEPENQINMIFFNLLGLKIFKTLITCKLWSKNFLLWEIIFLSF